MTSSKIQNIILKTILLPWYSENTQIYADKFFVFSLEAF